MNENGKSRIGLLLRDEKLMEKAMRKAVREALIRHRQAGVPIVEWLDGKIVVTPAEEIVLPPEDD
jgi:hypothetical protein